MGHEWEKRPRTKRKRIHHRTRRDAGSRRPKSRDADLLRLGAEQTFVRYDTVGEALAPDHSPATDTPPPAQLEDTSAPVKRAWPQDSRHRLMAVSRLMRKLEAQGTVEIIQPWADQPAWFRVTTQGLRSIGLDWEEIPYPESYKDLEARLRHDRSFKSHHHLVNQVRMLLARGALARRNTPGKANGPSRSRCHHAKKAYGVHIKPTGYCSYKRMVAGKPNAQAARRSGASR